MARDADPILVALGQAVRDLRIERSMTQEALADAAGLHVTYISGIERGVKNVGFINLARVARGLGVDLPAVMAAVEEHRGGESGVAR